MNTTTRSGRASFWLSLSASLLFSLPAVAYEADTAARAAAERLLEVAGGRDNWRGVYGAKILAVNYFAQFDLPVWFEFEIDFRSPYVRTRIAGDQMNRLRVFEGSRGWSMKQEGGAQQLTQFTAERLVQEKIQWEGAFSRALYRIAIEDPSLKVVLASKERLEVSNVGGSLVTWYKLGANGYPVMFGIGDASESDGTRLEKASRFGPYLLPATGISSDGDRFDTVSVHILTNPVQHATDAPSSLDSVSWQMK